MLYFYIINDLWTTTTCQQRPLFWGTKGGRCTQVWPNTGQSIKKLFENRKLPRRQKLKAVFLSLFCLALGNKSDNWRHPLHYLTASRLRTTGLKNWEQKLIVTIWFGPDEKGHSLQAFDVGWRHMTSALVIPLPFGIECVKFDSSSGVCHLVT